MYRDEGAWRDADGAAGRGRSRGTSTPRSPPVRRRVQLFDSWVGCLSRTTIASTCCRTCKAVIDGRCTPGVPLIHFATGNPGPAAADGRGRRDGDRRRLAHAAGRRLADGRLRRRGRARQSRPRAACARATKFAARAKDVLSQAGGRPGHIFNLGHGVLQQTPVENVVALVEMVHEMSAR